MINPVKLGNRLVGPGYPPYIIAEACINHEGDIKIAKKMIYMAHALGVDCIKFQIHCLEDEMLRETPQSDNFDESLWDALERTNFDIEQQKVLKSLCEELGIAYLCTPFSRQGSDQLESMGVDFFKTGSGELTNLPLIEHIAKKKKPMIVSTGMSSIEEISETVDLIKSIGAPLILTHCVSAYPCPPELVNLGMIPKYEELFEIPIGLSDHTQNIYTSIGSVAYGACVIEKHFTFNKLAKGPDHASSIEPYEFGELVKGAEAVFKARGNKKEIFEKEKQIVSWARESVVTTAAIAKGEALNESNIWVKRPSPKEGAIAAKDYKNVLGKKALNNIPKDVQIKWSDISN